MHILSLELGVFGGLVTSVYSYILSESLLCHSTAVEIYLCLVLYCVGDLNPYPLSCPGNSVGRALMPSKQRVVGSNPTQGNSFSLKKGLLWVCRIVCLCLVYNLVYDTCCCLFTLNNIHPEHYVRVSHLQVVSSKF